jgi:hypothetical protein
MDRQDIEISKRIIREGRISTADFGESFTVFGFTVFMLIICVYGFYYVNTHWTNEEEPNNVLWGNIALFLITITLIWSLVAARNKLQIRFYEDDRPLDRKYVVINRLQKSNHWKLKKKEENYYLFFENNLMFQSYYITIIPTEKGFYINSFPSRGRVIDLGDSQKNSDEIFEEIESIH